MSNTVYEIITKEILERLEKGEVPWHKPWTGGQAMNLVSKKAYRGINVFLLGMCKYSSPYWVSFKQCQDLGGHVRKGEKSHIVVFWKQITVTSDNTVTDDKKDKTIPLLRYYRVFNTDQCNGLKIPELEANQNFQPISTCEEVVNGMQNKPAIKFEEPSAYYHPAGDYVNMPNKESFEKEAFFYSVLFHELGHSTGHESRLHRKSQGEWSAFGSEKYSKEELCAEMTAAFLCGHCQIENQTIDNSAAYIQSWLGKLRNDPKMVVLAAAQAQKAADYILNINN